jgi:hypothetical protein
MFPFSWRSKKMSQARRFCLVAAALLAVLVLVPSPTAQAQESYAAPNAGPNPYQTITGWAKLPDGRKWGSTAGVDIGPDGTLWAYDRCAPTAAPTRRSTPCCTSTPTATS